jgi:hypothetical protein
MLSPEGEKRRQGRSETEGIELDAREVLKDYGLWRTWSALRAIRGRSLLRCRYGCWCLSRHWAAPSSATYCLVSAGEPPVVQPLDGPYYEQNAASCLSGGANVARMWRRVLVMQKTRAFNGPLFLWVIQDPNCG